MLGTALGTLGAGQAVLDCCYYQAFRDIRNTTNPQVLCSMCCLTYWEEADCPGLTQLLIRLKHQGLGMAASFLYPSVPCVESLVWSAISGLSRGCGGTQQKFSGELKERIEMNKESRTSYPFSSA